MSFLGLGKGSGAEGEDKTYLWLIAGVMVLIVALGVLAFLVWRGGNESAGLIAALGLPTPAPTRPAPPPVPPVTATPPITSPTTPSITPVRPVTPTATVPVPATTAWYFAQGSSAAPFHTNFVLVNPNEAAVQGKVTLLRESATPTEATFTVQGQSRLTLQADKLLPNAAFAARFQSDRPFYVERVVTFGHDAHSVTGALPAKTWYLPLVNTAAGYDDVILLANFNPTPAKATLTFLSAMGVSQTIQYAIPAMARLPISATTALLPSSKIQPGSLLGAIVESDQPLVVEQSTYFENVTAGYATGGSPLLSKTWYLAEGNSRPDFSTLLAVLNPGNRTAKLNVTFLPEGKARSTQSYTVNAASAMQIRLNVDVPDSAVATLLEADQPVAVERVTSFNVGRSAHANLGAVAPAKEWFLPEASTVSPNVPVLIILNPGDAAAEVTVLLFRETGRPVEKKLTIAAASRFALLLSQVLPNAALSAQVRSSQPVVVERVTYFKDALGGMSSLGIAIP